MRKNVWEGKNCFVKNKVIKKYSLEKRKKQINDGNIFQISKDNTTLNLLIDTTRSTIFSKWSVKFQKL